MKNYRISVQGKQKRNYLIIKKKLLEINKNSVHNKCNKSGYKNRYLKNYMNGKRKRS